MIFRNGKSWSSRDSNARAIRSSSLRAGMIASTEVLRQSFWGVGTVRSQPRIFPARARRKLGDRSQYETAAIGLFLYRICPMFSDLTRVLITYMLTIGNGKNVLDSYKRFSDHRRG